MKVILFPESPSCGGENRAQRGHSDLEGEVAPWEQGPLIFRWSFLPERAAVRDAELVSLEKRGDGPQALLDSKMLLHFLFFPQNWLVPKVQMLQLPPGYRSPFNNTTGRWSMPRALSSICAGKHLANLFTSPCGIFTLTATHTQHVPKWSNHLCYTQFSFHHMSQSPCLLALPLPLAVIYSLNAIEYISCTQHALSTYKDTIVL